MDGVEDWVGAIPAGAGIELCVAAFWETAGITVIKVIRTADPSL